MYIIQQPVMRRPVPGGDVAFSGLNILKGTAQLCEILNTSAGKELLRFGLDVLRDEQKRKRTRKRRRGRLSPPSV